MATSRGAAAVRQLIANTPAQLDKVLRGAGRAAAKVVADEAKLRSRSAEVSGSLKIRTSAKDGRIIAKVQSRGPGSYIAPWLEYGTAPHFISVDDSQRQGRSIGRINHLAKEDGHSHSLVIGGKFVGATVFHPGAHPYPFLRPALDAKEGEAVAKAQSYINARVRRSGIVQTADEGDA